MPMAMASEKVGDALSLYVWQEPARRLAATGLDANALAGASVALGALAFLLFWRGQFALGLACAAAGILIELAGSFRETRWGWREIVIAVIPLFWWWGWSHGLAAWGRMPAPVYGIMILWAAVGGSVADLVVERLFERRFGSLRLAAWQRFDSRFALGAAGPSINLVILALSLVARRPDAGLVVVAWWTIATVIVHAVRLAQAGDQAARGVTVKSWLGE